MFSSRSLSRLQALCRAPTTRPGSVDSARSYVYEGHVKNRFLPDPQTIAIVGCPFSGGQPRKGVDNGPTHLIQAGLVERLTDLGLKVEFDGHLKFEKFLAEQEISTGILKNPRLVSRVCQSVAETVQGHIKQGRLPVMIGGDHSLGMGTVSGTLSQYPDAGVIWVDAHADINTAASTLSGNIHGMPVSFLLGLPGNEGVKEFGWLKPLLKPERLVYIGLRDVDPAERQIIKENGIKAFSIHEVDRYGIGKVMEMALDHINPGRNRPIHLSFDVDALDPSVAPSTGTPVRGGLTFREGHYVCEAIHETGLMVALDLVEVNPSLKDELSAKQTVAVGCSLVSAALGETLL